MQIQSFHKNLYRLYSLVAPEKSSLVRDGK